MKLKETMTRFKKGVSELMDEKEKKFYLRLFICFITLIVSVYVIWQIISPIQNCIRQGHWSKMGCSSKSGGNLKW